MEFNVQVVNYDPHLIDRATEFGIFAASEQALKDCNYFCKQDTSALINSSLIHSDTRHGVLRWVTPYAAFQYTFPNTRHDINPNACPGWAQHAAEVHKATWCRVLGAAMNNYMGGSP